VVVGCGKRNELNLETVRCVAAVTAKTARDLRLKRIAMTPPGENTGIGAKEVGQAIAEGINLALYRYDRFKSSLNGQAPTEVEEVSVVGGGPAPELEAGLRSGEMLAAATITARDLATGPGNFVTATYLGQQASDLAGQYGFSAQVFDKAELERMGCGGILAVNAGSAEPPVMGVLHAGSGR
jgi:leucyl aminopeptidase